MQCLTIFNKFILQDISILIFNLNILQFTEQRGCRLNSHETRGYKERIKKNGKGEIPCSGSYDRQPQDDENCKVLIQQVCNKLRLIFFTFLDSWDIVGLNLIANATPIIPCSHGRWKDHARATALEVRLRCSQQAGAHQYQSNQIRTTIVRIRARVLGSNVSLRWKRLAYPERNTLAINAISKAQTCYRL